MGSQFYLGHYNNPLTNGTPLSSLNPYQENDKLPTIPLPTQLDWQQGLQQQARTGEDWVVTQESDLLVQVATSHSPSCPASASSDCGTGSRRLWRSTGTGTAATIM